MPLIILIGAYVLLSSEFFISSKGGALLLIRGATAIDSEITELREKNKALEIVILNLKVANPAIYDLTTEKGVRAKVFSAYPFADRSKLTVNTGSKHGVEVGDAVILANSLVGRVMETHTRISIVQTIFDPEFKIPVRIGDGELDALYIGGVTPRLNMISANASPQYGELVLAVSPELPYGLGMGRVLQVTEGPLRGASIRPLFEIKEIRDVFILTN